MTDSSAGPGPRDPAAALAERGGAPVTPELRVGGMDCASCAASVEKALRRLDKVTDVSVDVVGGKVRVGSSGGGAGRAQFARAIRAVGYTVEEPTRTADDAETRAGGDFWRRRGRLVMTGISGLALAAGLVNGWLGGPTALQTAMLAIATVAGGWYVAPRGVRAAWNRSLDMNFLMTLAAAGAWLIGEQGEAAATLFLFAVAELLESYSMDRARNAIRALMELSPSEATVRREGGEVRIPADEVRVGEVVIVRPGEKLPADGVVVGGRSSVNQAPITGESMPVDKEVGHDVFAGSLNGQGVLEIKSNRPARDTTLARIIHAVEEAQASRAPSQTFVDRFARLYTPAVVGIALLIAVVPPLVGVGSWDTWIYRALAMLVVACPCALVISTPVTIVSGLTGAARAGILIKGGAHLENLGRVTVLAIDKTGTLTVGRPSVTDVVPMDGVDADDVLSTALAVERHSEHPLAAAIVSYATDRGLTNPESVEFEALIGRGARALVTRGGSRRELLVGNLRFIEELGAATASVRAAMQRLENEGKTAVSVAERTVGRGPLNGARVIGVIGIADQPRPEARAALSALHDAGVRRVALLTGDNEGTAAAIGRALGVDERYAGLLPDDKVRIVRTLESAGECVAFVGDGVNDAPALAAATVGIAMGAAGTDVALETADVALMGDDLSNLARAVKMSRRTLRIVRQNIWFSLAVKAVFLVLTLGGWATLWMAVAADMGGSLLVVANGLRARLSPR